MWVILSLAFPAGAALGSAQLRAWTLIPATAILAAVTAAVCARSGIGADRTALVIFCAATLLQVSYLVGSVLSDVPGAFPVPDRVPSRQELLGIVRTAIAGELPTHFEPPLGDLPPQMSEKLALLEASWASRHS